MSIQRGEDRHARDLFQTPLQIRQSVVAYQKKEFVFLLL